MNNQIPLSVLQTATGLISLAYLVYVLVWASKGFKRNWPTATFSKIVLPVVVVFLSITAVKILIAQKKPQERKPRPPRVVSVAADVVKFQDWKPTITAYGSILSKEPIPLLSEVAGVLEAGEKPFRAGVRFKKGDVLAQVDNRRAMLQFQSSVSDLLAALASFLPEIKADISDVYPKWKKYFDAIKLNNLPDLPEYDNNKEKLYLSRYNIFKLHFNARNHEILLQKHKLRAPFNGVVDRVQVQLGTAISPGLTIASLTNTSALEIEAGVPVGDVRWLKSGSEATATVRESRKIFNTKVTRISQVIDGTNQSQRVYLSVPSSIKNKLMDGMFVNLEFKGETIGGSLKIPRSSVSQEGQIFLIKNGELKTQTVEIVRIDLEHAYVKGELTSGDTLLIQNLPTAIPGMKVSAIFSGQQKKDLSTRQAGVVSDQQAGVASTQQAESDQNEHINHTENKQENTP